MLPAGRDATASTVVTGPETTARVSALEGSSIVTGPETTARVSALEGTSIVTVLTIVFGAYVADVRRRAGRQAQGAFGVRAPWCPPSSWRVLRDSKDFSLPAPGVSGALSSPWALERKAGGNPRKSTSDHSGPTPLLNPGTPLAPDAVTFAGTRCSSQARRRCSPAEVRDSVEVAAPRRDRRRSKCTDSMFRTDAAIPDFAHRLVFTLHRRYCTWGSTRLRVWRSWCRLVVIDSVTTPC
ncbi:hypothetical protein NDU88_004228 [Pleurodeles waltl]|uniref:Uncharacterized protein n=1 Tax=Pleurodeles waltl TaxID=8319 RepID=A0AAV7M9C5_PLEWA|nr:hypothetical protein NDU88_004228 [Pleurodeles waltl]